jgi:beta-galactosidase
VELFANGVSLGVKEAPDHFFYFEVPNVGETKLVAVAGECHDESTLRKVSEPNPAYILTEKGAVLNWWDIIHIDGYADLNTKLSKVLEAAVVDKCCQLLQPVLGMAAQPAAVNMLDAMTVLRMINVITGMMRMPVTKEQLMDLNAELNKIKLL